jgi:hypothetical protein
MKKIKLTQGMVALVDDEDFEFLHQFKWYASFEHVFYAKRTVVINGIKRKVYMHHAVIGKPAEDMVCDHIDGNGLNNTKNNLRFLSRSQNSRNRHKHKNNSSSYVGVCWHKGRNRWVSRIKRDGKSIHLGYFAEEEKAHKAYEHAREEWGKDDGR